MVKHFFFLHIPKAGGSTLRRVLQRQFARESVYLIEDDINGDIARYTECSPVQARAYALVMGHMRFGLHLALNSKDYCYLSMLREPVARVVSEYNFIKSNPHHSLHWAIKDMSLDAYLDSGVSDQISNGQVRLLSGAEAVLKDGSTAHREMAEDDLKRALNNVAAHFKGLGFIERYDASLLRWKQAFNWRLPFYMKENITLKPKKIEPMSAGVRHKIMQLNALDIQLYETLLKQFDANISQAGLGFKINLLGFQLLNKIYQKTIRLRTILRSKLWTKQ